MTTDSCRWWAFEDKREDSPLLSTDQWNTLCLNNGFSGLEVCCPDHNGPTKRTTMMVAEAVSPAAEPEKVTPRVRLLRGLDSLGVNGIADSIIPALKTIEGLEYIEESWDNVVSNVDHDAVYIVLDTTEQPILLDITPDRFNSVQSLLVNGINIFWISLQETESAEAEARKGLIRGASRVLRRENGLLRFITMDIQQLWKDINPENLTKSLLQISKACFWPASETERSNEYEFGYSEEHTMIPRVQKDNKFYNWVNRVTRKNEQLETLRYHQADRPLRLEVGTPGLLGSLHFVDDETLRNPLDDNFIEVETRAYGINFKDVFIALGQMAPGVTMVGEVAGIVTKVGKIWEHRYKVGDRVTGVDALPFASHARLNGNLAHKIPDSISFEIAASVPTVYLTAWYALVHVSRLAKGQTVLIHAASGGVGQAAIQLAQYLGATIFATVGSEAKANLLVEEYGLPEDHIFSTRSRNFKEGVLRKTGGRGVDVVLNSLSGEMLSDSWEVVAQLGYFIEIGKTDIYKRSSLSMKPFDRGVTFVGVDLIKLFDNHSPMLHDFCGKIFNLFEQGGFRALSPVNVLPIEKIEDAFRLIASRKHTGKVVLRCDEDAIVKARPPKPQRLGFTEKGTYVIAGGLGDLGKRIAKWLSAHGAGHIVTLSRRTLDECIREEFESEINANGATLHMVKCDILDEASVLKAAEYCSNLPSVRGVIHGGMVLKDHPMTHMTQEDFNAALGPKVLGTVNLDKAFASENLDFFVMMSSLTCIMGNPAQSNYAAGNAFQDAFAHSMENRSNHTKYISINLGAIQGSDSIQFVKIREQELIRNSAVLMSFDEMWLVLEYAMGVQGRADGLVQEILGFSRESMIAVDDRLALENPLFCQLPFERNKKDTGDSSDKVDAPAAIKAAKTVAEIEEIITKAIVSKFAMFMDK
jgi:NADPH:quinone reductase-like Zn-dependent oxidoreductase/NADP-dependent 3-hydroxy acid dehydrogenase YdfG